MRLNSGTAGWSHPLNRLSKKRRRLHIMAHMTHGGGGIKAPVAQFMEIHARHLGFTNIKFKYMHVLRKPKLVVISVSMLCLLAALDILKAL